MIRYLAVLLAVLPLGAKQSVVLTGVTGTANLPNSSPFRTADLQNQSFTFQFRVHDAKGSSAAYGERFLWKTDSDQFWCGIDATNLLTCTDWWDSLTDTGARVGVADKTDFVVTLVRDVSSKTFYAEVCNVDLTGCVTSQKQTITGLRTGSSNSQIRAILVGGPSTSAKLGFLRWQSGALNSPAREYDAAANLASWEFEGNGTDSSGHSLVMSFSRGVQYAATPSYAPGCSAGIVRSFRAGAPARLDGRKSVALNGTARLSYSWQQLDGPSDVVFDSPNAAEPTVSGLVFGTYVFGLTVTDASEVSSTCTVKIGAVATDSNGIVLIPHPEHARILSPLTRYGVNPWPWYDEREKAMSDWLVSVLDTRYTPYWDNSEPGTITVTDGSTVIKGDGTSFQTRFCGGAGKTAPVGSGRIVIWYPSLLYPGTTGRRAYPVRSCDSATQLTLGRPGDNSMDWRFKANDVMAAGSDLYYSYTDDEASIPWGFGPAPANYYDNVLALYVMYYRTGIDDYLHAARTLADRWWSWLPIDKGHGYSSDNGYWIYAEPRSVSLTGMMLRALDDRPEMWAGIRRIINFYAASTTSAQPVEDLRNQGYQLLWTSLAALFDPDADQRSLNLSRVAAAIENKWTRYRQPDGSWLMTAVAGSNNLAGGGGGYSGTAAVVNGSATVTGNGTNFAAGGTGGCAAGNHIWFTSAGSIWDARGGNSGDPQAYVIQSRESNTQLTLREPYRGSSGTKNFECQGFVGAGVQPFMLSISGAGLRWAQAALAEGQGTEGAAETLRNYVVGIGQWLRTTGTIPGTRNVYYGRTFATCETTPVLGACINDGNVEAQRINTAESLAGMIQEYMFRPSAALRDDIDAYMNALYAKPGSGASVSDPQYMSGLESYMFNPENPLYIPKWYGFFFGIGANWAWPGVRLGGLAPADLRTVPVKVGIADVADAVRAVLTVTRPDGSKSQVSCDSSPCDVEVDLRQGGHLMEISYLSAAGDVLSASKPELLQVPDAQ